MNCYLVTVLSEAGKLDRQDIADLRHTLEEGGFRLLSTPGIAFLHEEYIYRFRVSGVGSKSKLASLLVQYGGLSVSEIEDCET